MPRAPQSSLMRAAITNVATAGRRLMARRQFKAVASGSKWAGSTAPSLRVAHVPTMRHCRAHLPNGVRTMAVDTSKLVLPLLRAAKGFSEPAFRERAKALSGPKWDTLRERLLIAP